MTDDQAERLITVLERLEARLQLAEPVERAHACYRCGRLTLLGTAWCQWCLNDAAREHDRRPPPRIPPRYPYPRREVG